MPQQRVLILDDNLKTRRSLSQMFATDGYSVITASTCQQAEAHLTCDVPDLILANVARSSPRSLDMLTYVKLVFPAIPVLVITISAEDSCECLHHNGHRNGSAQHGQDDNLLERIGLALTR